MKGIIINEIGHKENGLYSTAVDDYSLRNVKEDTMILHLFQHSGINMGRDDTKNENFDQGIAYYKQQGVPVVLRQSGGRSIVSDKGVLSFSLTYITDHNDVYLNFEDFSDFIKDAFKGISDKIETGLIQGAYCPGDSDMSIDGKKFCGTAQKKLKNAIEMDAYIAISGDQKPRTELVQGFYKATNFTDFEVLDDKMESLANLAQTDIDVEEAGELLILALKRRCDEIEYLKIEDLDQDLFEKSLAFTKKKHEIL